MTGESFFVEPALKLQHGPTEKLVFQSTDRLPMFVSSHQAQAQLRRKFKPALLLLIYNNKSLTDVIMIGQIMFYYCVTRQIWMTHGLLRSSVILSIIQ